MSIKDELKELAKKTIEDKQYEYNETMEQIRNEIEKAIRDEEHEVSVFFASWGYNDFTPSRSTIDKVMEEIDLPYEDAYGNESYGVTINLKELYEDDEI